MTMMERQGGILYEQEPDWVTFDKRPLECVVFVLPDEDGGFYAYMPTLPGVISQGETPREALANIADAFRGAVSVYRESNDPIPWNSAPEERPRDATEFRIVVDV